MGQWPKHQIVKLLGENIGLNTHIFEFGVCSLVMMPKSGKTIEKNKLGLLQLKKKILVSKAFTNKEKRSLKIGKNIFKLYIW